MLVPRASSLNRHPVTSISASSSFSFIEHLLVACGHALTIQESDACSTTSMYDIQNRFIPDEIGLFYFTTWVITHNNNVIEQNIDVSMFDILSAKKPHTQLFTISITCNQRDSTNHSPSTCTLPAALHFPMETTSVHNVFWLTAQNN